jgi:hypothetical protein
VASLVLAASAYALDIADATPPDGTVGVPYQFTFSLSPGSGSPGSSWGISSGALPPGLALSSNDRTALVYGTPTQAGSFSFWLEARDKPGPWVCCTQELFTITINPALVIAVGDLPVGNLGQDYGYQLSTSGGTGRNWVVMAGTLPAGMQLTPEGAIVGTPTQAAVSQFTVKAVDGDRSATKQLTLKVTQPMSLAAPVAKAIKLGRQFLVGFSVKGGLGPYTFTGVNLPTGIGVNPATGQVGGRPKAAGPMPITITVTDSLGATVTATATVMAATAPVVVTKKLPVAHVGKRFHAAVVTAGGAGQLTLRLVGAPAWLRLDKTGKLSGSPKLKLAKAKKSKQGKHIKRHTSAIYKVHVTTFDTIGQRATKTLTLTVKS